MEVKETIEKRVMFKTAGKPVVVIRVPVKHDAEKAIGVLDNSINTEFFTSKVNRIKP